MECDSGPGRGEMKNGHQFSDSDVTGVSSKGSFHGVIRSDVSLEGAGGM